MVCSRSRLVDGVICQFVEKKKDVAACLSRQFLDVSCQMIQKKLIDMVCVFQLFGIVIIVVARVTLPCGS